MAQSSLNIIKRFDDEGLARLISDLGNPLFMPPVVLAFCSLLLGQSLQTTATILVTAVICYTALPFALTMYLLNNGFITSVDLPIRETRTNLYYFSIGSSAIASFALYQYLPSAHDFLLMLSFVFLINLSIAFLLNLKWKISVHSASIAVAGTVYGFLYFWGITEYATITIILSLLHLFIILPIMVWGRYHLKAHSAGELIGGSSSGIILTISEIMIIYYLW
jgi:hypothetical protein